MTITRDEVLKALCAITTKVGKHLDNMQPYDCFCRAFADTNPNFQFSPEVIAFIEQAVQAKIELAQGVYASND